FLHSDNGLRREDAMNYIRALLDWIESRSELDSKRVMIWGASYGGYMALSAAHQFGKRIHCVISEYGIANLATFIERMEPSRRELQRGEFGDERIPKVRAFMERTAPLNNAEKIKIPLLIVHGKNDPRVSITEAVSIIQSVSKHGNTIWSLIANNEGHGFTNPTNWIFRLNAIILFTQKCLLEE